MNAKLAKKICSFITTEQATKVETPSLKFYSSGIYLGEAVTIFDDKVNNKIYMYFDFSLFIFDAQLHEYFTITEILEALHIEHLI